MRNNMSCRMKAESKSNKNNVRNRFSCILLSHSLLDL